jgi:DNA-binding FadR family transcriptional regulator
MTRQTSTLAPPPRTDKRARLSPLAPARNRTHDVVERIAGEIRSGALRAGDRLPTEQEMVAAFGVSRTVVREALAALKADGLVMTRQGSGAYVANVTDLKPFRLRDDQIGAVENIADVLELRLAVEVEATSLAASRATPTALRRIALAHGRFTKAVERGEEAVEDDIAFHGAIAAATGNPQFSRFLAFLGGFLIPRQRVNLRKL